MANITLKDENNIPTNTQQTLDSLVNNREIVLNIPIPNHLHSIKIEIKAKLKITKYKQEELNASHNIEVSTASTKGRRYDSQSSRIFYNFYLKSISDNYYLYVLGKNSEPYKN